MNGLVMQLNNYIPDQNKFSLVGPPLRFQRKLHNFDSSLVLLPSRVSFLYRLGQRQPVTLNTKLVNDLHADSDTMMLATYGLIPVTTLLPMVDWDSPLLLNDLAKRAPWRNGGAAKVIKEVEERDRVKEQKLITDQRDVSRILAKDSWKLFRKMTGLGRSWHHTLDPQYS